MFYFVAAKAEVMRSDVVCHFVGLSICLCAASRKKLCIDLHEIVFVGLAQSQGDFILELIRTDLQCHLEVTHSRPARSFRHKSTVAQKR